MMHVVICICQDGLVLIHDFTHLLAHNMLRYYAFKVVMDGDENYNP
jgi:hypothetical protein